MRRALVILKYVPAVLCGLLVVAWVGSWFQGYRVSHERINLTCVSSSLVLSYDHRTNRTDWRWQILPYGPDTDRAATRFWLGFVAWGPHLALSDFACPLPPPLTLLFPLAIGPFTRFRFPLWSYFAWTALVAAELAYYLR